MTYETETGFGCGLRAQINLKQTPPDGFEALEVMPAVAAADAQSIYVPVQPSGPDLATLQSEADLAGLQFELESSRVREQQLRESFEHHVEAYEREQAAGRDLAVLEAETSQRAAKLDAAHAELEERDAALQSRNESLDHERAAVAAIRAELVAEEARLAELARHVEAQTHQLESADEERAQSSAELAKHLAGIAERERELKREAAAIEARHQAAEARVAQREQSVRQQDEAARSRERAAEDRYRASESAMADVMRERERLQQRAEAAGVHESAVEERIAAREGALAERMVAHERAVTESEAALAAWQDRLRTDDERQARERAGHGQAAQEAFTLLAELERREATVKQEEEGLRREQQRVAAIAERATELQAREEALAVAKAAADQHLSAVAERARELDAREEALAVREMELDSRHATPVEDVHEFELVSTVLSLGEARFEADLQLREDKLDDLARDLREREELLAARESDLADYVNELQGRFSQHGELAEVHALNVA